MNDNGTEDLYCMHVINNIVTGEDVYVYTEGEEIEDVCDYAEHTAKLNEDYFDETFLAEYIQKHLLEGETCIFTFEDTNYIWTMTRDEIKCNYGREE